MAFKLDVNLGHVLIALPLIVGTTGYFVTDHNTVQQLTTTVNKIQTDLVAGFKEVKDDTKSQVGDVRKDIASLPNVQAEIAQIIKNQDAADQRYGQMQIQVDQNQRTNDIQDGKISNLQDTLQRIAPLVDQLDRASKIPLGRATR